MSTPFSRDRGLVVVPVEIEGPTGTAILRLALDTGATLTLINTSVLVAIGYDPAIASSRVEMTTGSGVEYAPKVEVAKVTSIGRERKSLPILAHTLPPSTGVDGLLGLDFFNDFKLTINFRDGTIDLS